MANKFTVGNCYKNSSREVVILITSRTKCFINYKELWIGDLINGNGKPYSDGRVKVRLNDDNDEYVLVDGFSKHESCNEYVMTESREEVKETFELTDDNKACIKAIVEFDPAGRQHWDSLVRIAYNKLETWVDYPYDDCRDIYEGALLVLSNLSANDKKAIKCLSKNYAPTLINFNANANVIEEVPVCNLDMEVIYSNGSASYQEDFTAQEWYNLLIEGGYLESAAWYLEQNPGVTVIKELTFEEVGEYALKEGKFLKGDFCDTSIAKVKEDVKAFVVDMANELYKPNKFPNCEDYIVNVCTTFVNKFKFSLTTQETNAYDEVFNLSLSKNFNNVFWDNADIFLTAVFRLDVIRGEESWEVIKDRVLKAYPNKDIADYVNALEYMSYPKSEKHIKWEFYKRILRHSHEENSADF
jgi:hypothetical protein